MAVWWYCLGVQSSDGSVETPDVHKIGAVPCLFIQFYYISVLRQLFHLINVLYLSQNQMKIQSYFPIFLIDLFDRQPQSCLNRNNKTNLKTIICYLWISQQIKQRHLNLQRAKYCQLLAFNVLFCGGQRFGPACL